jgi:hypothetical protein
LFLGQRSEESRGGTRHPFGRRSRGQPFPVLHDPIIRLRPPGSQLRAIRSRTRVADVDVLQWDFRVMLGE